MARPSKYRDGKVNEGEYEPSCPEKLVAFMAEGGLDCNICAKFGISKQRFYQWINEYPEFKKAHDIGMPLCESWWIEWGQSGMRGEIKGFNFNAWIAFMNNKFKWAKGTYGDSATNITTNNISVQNMNVLQSKDKAGLIDYIKRIGEKNQDVLNVEFTESTENNQSNES